MLGLFIVVGCAAKALNKRLERRYAEYVDTRSAVHAGNLFPLKSTQTTDKSKNNRAKEFAVGNRN